HLGEVFTLGDDTHLIRTTLDPFGNGNRPALGTVQNLHRDAIHHQDSLPDTLGLVDDHVANGWRRTGGGIPTTRKEGGRRKGQDQYQRDRGWTCHGFLSWFSRPACGVAGCWAFYRSNKSL